MNNPLSDIFANLESDDGNAQSADAPAFQADGCFTTAAAARRFMLAGDATVTLVSKKTETRFTFKVSKPEDGDGSFFFVSVLNGPDNWANYAYFGYIRRGVFFHGGHKARVAADAPSVKAWAWTWASLAQDHMPATVKIWHEGKCGRCNRKLTVPSSIASGFGPECINRIGE